MTIGEDQNKDRFKN